MERGVYWLRGVFEKLIFKGVFSNLQASIFEGIGGGCQNKQTSYTVQTYVCGGTKIYIRFVEGA